jgi:hypothetical protein
MYSFSVAFIASSSLGSIRDRDTFFNYPVKIEALSITFPVSTFSPVKTADRFFAVLSAFAKSLI